MIVCVCVKEREGERACVYVSSGLSVFQIVYCQMYNSVICDINCTSHQDTFPLLPYLLVILVNSPLPLKPRRPNHEIESSIFLQKQNFHLSVRTFHLICKSITEHLQIETLKRFQKDLGLLWFYYLVEHSEVFQHQILRNDCLKDLSF